MTIRTGLPVSSVKTRACCLTRAFFYARCEDANRLVHLDTFVDTFLSVY